MAKKPPPFRAATRVTTQAPPIAPSVPGRRTTATALPAGPPGRKPPPFPPKGSRK